MQEIRVFMWIAYKGKAHETWPNWNTSLYTWSYESLLFSTIIEDENTKMGVLAWCIIVVAYTDYGISSGRYN